MVEPLRLSPWTEYSRGVLLMFLWQTSLPLHCWELSYRSSVRVHLQPGEFYWVRTRKSV